MKKEALALDQWNKELAPSTALRQWFGHDAARWNGFAERYGTELQQHAEQLDALRALAHKGAITLVYGAHGEEHNTTQSCCVRCCWGLLVQPGWLARRCAAPNDYRPGALHATAS